MDSNRIGIHRCFNYEEVLYVLANETIKNEIFEDGAQFVYPDLINEYWLVLTNLNGKIIGCYRIHKISAITYQVHANILPSYRKKYSIDASEKLLWWASENITNIKKLICWIPSYFKNIEKHCLALGFEKEGTVKKSYLKKGQVIDQHIYGMDMEATPWAQ